ncbi:MAG: polyphosphate kinase 2 family protein [Acidobacteriota bacterium]|nr:polyphosphate kinase 2 family protein [Acidobacteriota bacterium]
MKTTDFLVPEGKKFSLKKHEADFTGDYKNKTEARPDLAADTKRLVELQEKLFAEEKRALLVVFQGMDTAGKDAAIKAVTTGVNPQWFRVASFKPASEEELRQDYLRRFSMKLPERGLVGIYNRSHYEEVLIVRVHSEQRLQDLPDEVKNNPKIWQERFEQIRNYETYLVQNGIHVLKIFLNISKEEQKRRILERIDESSMNWKFSNSDVEEREFWDDYISAYEEAIEATSTKLAPWYIVPADNRWFSHVAIARILVEKLEAMNPSMPGMSKDDKQEMKEAKKKLENERS